MGEARSSRPVVGHTRHPGDGVWEVCLVVFCVYSLMPLRTLVALVTGLLLPAAQILVSYFVANAFPHLLWRQVCKKKDILKYFRILTS